MSQPTTETQERSDQDSEHYGATYYAEGLGESYDNTEHWVPFFRAVAREIVDAINPKSVFDVGCATGYLVEALREQGIDASGIDVSEYAIEHARPGAAGHIHVGSALEPLPQRYDLITCIEVIEHLPPENARAAVENLCRRSDDILFTSTPLDYREPTHFNVRAPEYWTELFAQLGYYRDVDFDAPSLPWWSMRFRRGRDPIARVLADYERVLWRHRYEASERTALINSFRVQVSDREALARDNEILRGDVAMLNRALNDNQGLLVNMEGELRTLREELSRLKSSAAGRIVMSVQDRARRLAPPGTLRQRSLHYAAHGAAVLVGEGPRALMERLNRRSVRRQAGDDSPERRRALYLEWLRFTEPDEHRLRQMRTEVASWPERPLISVILPVYNPEAAWLEEAIGSVIEQVYPHWELCIVDDASTQAHVRQILQRVAAGDSRIKVAYRSDNGGIVQASKDALGLATGDYVAFVDHDDILRPHALYAVVEHLQRKPEADVVYSDEDKLLVDGGRGDPMFKPDWSSELLLGWNYITHFTVIRRQLVDDVGGFRDGFDGSQDHDLLLRVTERTQHIDHLADILYTWRMVPGSAALSADYKPMARETGRRAVEDAIHRRGIEGRVEFGPIPGLYRVRYAIKDSPRVAIIIPTRDRVDMLRGAISSIEQSTYQNYSITIVNNGSRNAETLSYLQTLSHQVIDYDQPFNYSKIINLAAAAVDADQLLLLNNDMTVLTSDWIEALLEHSQRAGVGAVGARLLYPGGGVQHEGIVIGRGNLAGNIEMAWPVVREVSAVTGACMMTRVDAFRTVGGFDESLRVAFNDVDYCLRLRQQGYAVLYTPFAELTHHESASRGRLNPADDMERFVARWGDPDQTEDPYLNVNLLWPNPFRLRFGFDLPPSEQLIQRGWAPPGMVGASSASRQR